MTLTGPEKHADDVLVAIRHNLRRISEKRYATGLSAELDVFLTQFAAFMHVQEKHMERLAGL